MTIEKEIMDYFQSKSVDPVLVSKLLYSNSIRDHWKMMKEIVDWIEKKEKEKDYEIITDTIYKMMDSDPTLEKNFYEAKFYCGIDPYKDKPRVYEWGLCEIDFTNGTIKHLKMEKENKQFVWTDELVREFGIYTQNNINRIGDLFNEFKKSKEKKKWPEGILAIKKGGRILEHATPFDELYQLTLSARFKEGYEILTVRNSKGDVFSIGDKTNIGEIESFDINAGVIIAFHKNKVQFLTQIDYLKPVKKPIITTEDGIEIFKPRKVYYVSDHFIDHEFWLNSVDSIPSGVRVFSTEEAAKKYIKYNKPVFSRQDVIDSLSEWLFDPQASSVMNKLEKSLLNK